MSKKLVGIFSFCLLCFTLLYVKISWISFDGSLASVGSTQSTYTLSIATSRAQIYDCRLIPLVDCDKQYRAAIIPTPQNFIQLENNSVLTLPNKLTQNGLPFIATASLPTVNVPQVEVISIPKRYSKNQLAQHIIGYFNQSSNKGISGIELAYDNLLTKSSETTTVSYQLDGLRHPLMGVKPSLSIAPMQTSGVVLSIDSRIQQIVEESGARHIKKGAIVVLEPSTGKLKAVASFPQYNANNIDAAMKNEDAPLINRAYSAYSVGSIFKLVTAATALESGIPPEYKYTCKGSIELNGVTFGCHNKSGHGEIDMREAIAVSCNPYFINLSLHISKTNFLNMAKDLSFGRIDSAGKLPTSKDLKNIGDIANLSFGQGALTATPIQVAELVGAIVNDGKAIKSTIVDGTTTDGEIIDREATPFPTIAMSEKTASLLKEMMVTAVMDTPNQNSKPYKTTAGGKTATAQTGQFDGDGEILHGWFSGFFPAENPKYIITILVEDAESGNQSASPVFREIVDTLSQSPAGIW